jgi:PTH1 family peptidyl-tRNA hydrolase
MNSSGEAATAVQHFYKVYNPSTLVVYDELAINFGQLRTRVGGSDAGHNGVKSLIQHIGDDFNRLRIGVGSEVSEKADVSDYVLGKFTKKEQESIPLVLREANELINGFIFGGPLPHETRTIF